MLRAHPVLWMSYPDGDLSPVPERTLWELWLHLQAERADANRALAREIAAAMAKLGVSP